MLLLDSVLRWDEQSLVALSARHKRPDHPLAQSGVMPAVHLLEYAAQAAAVHIGLAMTAVAARRPPAGVLAYVRGLRLLCEHVSDMDPVLHIAVQRKARIPGGFAYAFDVRVPQGTDVDDLQDGLLAAGVFGVLFTGTA